MKKTNKILALALMAVAMVFASCSKDNDDNPVVPTQQEIEAKIIGKWKTVFIDGKPFLTNDKAVITYYRDKTMTMSVSRFFDKDGYVWENKRPYKWNVEGNAICETSISDGITRIKKFVEIDNNHYSHIDPSIIARKVTADYSQDIIGMWEGVDMTGYETYGDAHHRIEYHTDGTYTYYSWDESTQTWKPLEDVFDEWNVDGDWLATRWQNKGSDVMNYEWWDIDYIKKEGNDIIMKWSALREKEDGTRFNTTFTWKKVK